MPSNGARPLPRTPEQAQQELPAGFSQQVLDRVLQGLAAMAKRLEAMPSF